MYPVITPASSSRCTRVYAPAREMCSLAASARMDMRPSSHNWATMGPVNVIEDGRLPRRVLVARRAG